MADNVENQGGDQLPVFTEIEQKAVDQGWRPKDEWDGEPDAWRGAKEFLDRGELFKKIDDQNRTIKEFKRALDDLARHHANVRESEYKRARTELLAQKRDALLEQDADRVIQIDERLEAVKEAAVAAARTHVAQPAAELNPVFVSWVDKNGWYNSNDAMRAYADRIGNDLGAEGGHSVSDILREVERRVKKEFASKFENPNRQRVAAVEAGGSKNASKKESYDLNAEERRIMTRLVKTVPGMTEEKYIADLKKIKETR